MIVASISSATATPKPICWNMTSVAGREAGEDGDDDQRRAGDDPRRRARRRATTALARRRRCCVVALLDPAEQEHLVVHREAEQDREQEERHPGLDRVHLLEAEETGADAVLEDEHEQPVRGADREQVEQRPRSRATTIERNATVSRTKLSPSTKREHPRRRVDHRVEVVDVLGGRAADERPRRPVPSKHGGMMCVAQVADRGDRAIAGRGRRAPARRGRRRSPVARDRRIGPAPKRGSRRQLRRAAAREPPGSPSSVAPRRPRSRRGSSSRAGSRAGAPRSPASTRSGRGERSTPLVPDVQAEDRRGERRAGRRSPARG